MVEVGYQRQEMGSPKPKYLQLGFAMVYIDFAPLAVVSISAAQSDT